MAIVEWRGLQRLDLPRAAPNRGASPEDGHDTEIAKTYQWDEGTTHSKC